MYSQEVSTPATGHWADGLKVDNYSIQCMEQDYLRQENSVIRYATVIFILMYVSLVEQPSIIQWQKVQSSLKIKYYQTVE